MSRWYPPEKTQILPPLPCRLLQPRNPKDSRSRSGTPSPSGPGISSWITVRSAGIISWIYASSARRIRQARRVKSVLLLGGFATMLFIFTALAVGSRPVKFAPWITVSGSFRSTGISHPNHKEGIWIGMMSINRHSNLGDDNWGL